MASGDDRRSCLKDWMEKRREGTQPLAAEFQARLDDGVCEVEPARWSEVGPSLQALLLEAAVLLGNRRQTAWPKSGVH